MIQAAGSDGSMIFVAFRAPAMRKGAGPMGPMMMGVMPDFETGRFTMNDGTRMVGNLALDFADAAKAATAKDNLDKMLDAARLMVPMQANMMPGADGRPGREDARQGEARPFRSDRQLPIEIEMSMGDLVEKVQPMMAMLAMGGMGGMGGGGFGLAQESVPVPASRSRKCRRRKSVPETPDIRFAAHDRRRPPVRIHRHETPFPLLRMSMVFRIMSAFESQPRCRPERNFLHVDRIQLRVRTQPAAGPHLAGKKTKCPGCGAVLTIPAASEEAAPAPPPAARPKPAPAAAQVTAPAASAAAAAAVTCTCGKRIATKPEWAGKTIKCPACENRIKVPAAASPVVPAAAAAKPAPAKRPAPPPHRRGRSVRRRRNAGPTAKARAAAATSRSTTRGPGTTTTTTTADNAGRLAKGSPTPRRRRGGARSCSCSRGGAARRSRRAAGYVYMNPGILNPAPRRRRASPWPRTCRMRRTIRRTSVPNGKKSKPKAAAKNPVKNPVKDTDDPHVSDDPKPPSNRRQSEGRSQGRSEGATPEFPDLTLPPSEAPEKKEEPKKTTPPPTIDAPKFGPTPPAIKLDPDPDEPKDRRGAGQEDRLRLRAGRRDLVRGDSARCVSRFAERGEGHPDGGRTMRIPRRTCKKRWGSIPRIPHDRNRRHVVPADPAMAPESGIVLVESAKPIDFARFEKEADSHEEVAGKKMRFKNGDRSASCCCRRPGSWSGRRR